MEIIFFIIELIGVIAFAMSGALTAIRKELDIVGVIVLSIVAALGGGLIRDIILGMLPPNLFINPTYYIYEIVAVTIAVACFIFAYFTHKYEIKQASTKMILNIADAIGLSVFAIFGSKVAIDLNFGEYKLLLVFVGVITGVGGGATRDILVGEIPIIFRKYLYATPTIIGTLFYVIMVDFIDGFLAIILGIAIILSLRILAIIFKWDLPKIKMKEAPPPSNG